jgi:hypothetical protein
VSRLLLIHGIWNGVIVWDDLASHLVAIGQSFTGSAS